MTQLSSRLPFTDDPKPWLGKFGDESRSAIRGGGFEGEALDWRPRPEFDRPQANPTNLVLADLRIHWWLHGASHAAAYLDNHDYEATGMPAEHIEHARKVLGRLASFAQDEAAA